MRILFVIPHYFGAGPGCYGSSDVAGKQKRVASLQACISSLYQQFGGTQELLLHDGQAKKVNQQISCGIDIVVCVRGNDHLLDDLGLPEECYTVFRSNIENPLYLGFSCYEVLREAFGRYDWYCYLEDDLVIRDPLFFIKMTQFYHTIGDARYILQPNRFEQYMTPLPGKRYLDGSVWKDSAGFMGNLRLPGCANEINVPFGNMKFRMIPAENPHSGCFCLTNAHLGHLLEQPWYGEHVVGYVGPLESAASLYIMTLFNVFKPADECAGFLEVHHHYQKHVKD